MKPIVYSLYVRDLKSDAVLETLDTRLREIRKISPDSFGIFFYSVGKPDLERFESIRGKRIAKWASPIGHLVFPFFLWLEIKQIRQNLLALIVRHQFPSPLFVLLFRFRRFQIIDEAHAILPRNLATLPGIRGKILPPIVHQLQKLYVMIVDGQIGLTDEIIKAQASGAPALVLGNGIRDSATSAFRKFPDFDNRLLHAITLVSADWSWNGIPRMIRSMESWKIQNPGLHIKLSLVGPKRSMSQYKSTLIEISVTGELDEQGIRSLANSAHFGFSTLALYEAGMDEACPLKSRTYLELGLPFIAGYTDPDLPSSQRFLLQVTNDDSPVHYADIFKFLQNLASERDRVYEEFREARERLSQKSKARLLVDFVERLGRR